MFPSATDSAQVRLEVDSDWTLFRLEKTADADVAEKKRKYEPSKAKQQADKDRSRMRVNPRSGTRPRMKSNARLACSLMDR